MFQSCLSALAVSFLFRERLRRLAPSRFLPPRDLWEKNSWQRIWVTGDKRAHVGSMPTCRGREHSPVLFTQRDQRPSAVSDMISFGASDGKIDDSFFSGSFGCGGVIGLCDWPPPYYRCPLHVTPDSERMRSSSASWQGCQWARAQMEQSRSRLDECFLTGRYQAPANARPPSSPKFIRANGIMACPPLVSHPSFCFSCSQICWRHWRKRIWAPASSGWVCGRTSLPAHSSQMDGEGKPSVQAVQRHICTHWTRLRGGFSASLNGCAPGLQGQDARQWGSWSGFSLSQGPEERDRPGSMHHRPNHRSMSSLIVLERHLWLTMREMKEEMRHLSAPSLPLLPVAQTCADSADS